MHCYLREDEGEGGEGEGGRERMRELWGEEEEGEKLGGVEGEEGERIGREVAGEGQWCEWRERVVAALGEGWETREAENIEGW